MRHALVIASVIALLTPTPAIAHDTLSPTWCLDPKASPVIVSKFRLTPAQLEEYRSTHTAVDPATGEDCSIKSCGIVDDWHWANQMSQQVCQTAVKMLGIASAPAPFVDAPSDFNLTSDKNDNGILDHHDRYRFSDGDLTGVCVVCKPNTTPVSDDSATR